MKLFRIRDFRLIILIPSVILTILVLLVAANRSRYYMDKQTDMIVEKIGNKRGEEITNFYNMHLKQVEQSNYYLSKVPFLRENLELFERYGSAKDAGDRLSDALKDFKRGAPQQYSYDFQFTLPNGVTLYRSRDNSIGRYREEYEYAAIHTIKSKEPISGLEFSNEQIYLKSLLPIFRKDDFLGVSEVQMPMNELLRTFESHTNLKNAFFVDIENLPSGLTSKLQFLRPIANERKILYQVGGSKIDVDERLLFAETAKNNAQKYWVQNIGDRVFEFYALRDVAGVRVGFWVVVHDISELMQLKKQVENLQVILIPSVFILLTVSMYLILTSLVTSPLRGINRRMEAYSMGEFMPEVQVGKSTELNAINKWIDKLTERSAAVTDFASNLGQGNLDANYDTFGENDFIGNALVEMRDKLVLADKEARARADVEQREKWVTNGIAQMGDILREYSDDIANLNDSVITFLTSYIGVVQGAVYIIENESEGDPYLELSAATAYEQKKFLKKKITMGQGLVGTCAIEKEKIYLENIPADYVQITSGMGGGLPAFVFLFPLIMNEDLYGVVELSNFEKVEGYRLEFADRIAGSYAATLSNVQINTHTKRLLDEYKIQGQNLIKQEDSMRESLEGILKSQEEALLRERAVSSLIDSIDMSIIRLELSVEGMVISTNDYFLSLTEQLDEAVVGKHFESFVDVESRSDVKKAWASMQDQQPFNCRINLMDKFSQRIALVAVFSPIMDEAKQLVKTHFLAQKA